MSTYPNGKIPDHLLIRRGDFLLTAGTWAKFDDLVARVKRREDVTLRISTGSIPATRGAGAFRTYKMQVLVKAYWTLRGKSHMAAYPGTSSHGGEFNGVDALAIDITNYSQIPLHVFFEEGRAAGFQMGYFDGRNGRPYEPWHIIDRDPYRKVTAPAAEKNDPIPAEPEEEEDDMSRNIMYKTIEKGAKYPIRVGVTNDTSGLWLEFVDNQAGTMNTLAARYQTGDAVEVSGSMFAAARAAAAAVRPQTDLSVAVGTPES